jgi:hypothetical protein
MELDALKGRWQERGAPEPAWRKEEGVEDLRAKMAKLRRAAANRDLRETIAAVFVAVVFGWVALSVDRPLARAGAVIIAAGAVFIIIWMRAIGGRNIEPDADLPVREFAARELRYLDRQLALLRSTGWWYVAPNLIGIELFFLGSGRSDAFTAVSMVGAFLLGATVYWLNQMAAREAILPLRNEVAALVRELE